MKKIIILTTAFTISSLAIFAQNGKTKMSDTSAHKVYTCSMHPEVTSDKPGKCPKCGMTLIEKKTAGKDMHKGMHKDMDKMPMNKKDSGDTKKKIS